MRVRWLMVVVFVALLGAGYFVYLRLPQSFLPPEDAGWFLTIVQAPAGASLEYTSNAAKRVEAILQKTPEVEGVFSITGFSFAGNGPNQGLIFAALKPFAQRVGVEHGLPAILDRVRMQFFGLQDALVFAFAPPSIQGLGAFGGFTFEVLDQGGGTQIQNLAGATFGVIGAARQSKAVTGLFSGFTANAATGSMRMRPCVRHYPHCGAYTRAGLPGSRAIVMPAAVPNTPGRCRG